MRIVYNYETKLMEYAALVADHQGRKYRESMFCQSHHKPVEQEE